MLVETDLKSIDVEITAAGRDKGKIFRITEMDAFAAEKWAMKALIVLSPIIEIDPLLGWGGFVEVFTNPGLPSTILKNLSKIAFSDAEPLLNEMMSCVEILPMPGRNDIKRRLMPGDVREVATIFKLRMEVIKLQLGF